MIRKSLLRALGLGICCYSAAIGVATAEVTPGWYFGVSAGQSSADVSRSELDAELASLFLEEDALLQSYSSSLDDSDTGWSIFGGYRFSPYFAVEASYLDLGAVSYRVSADVAFEAVPGFFPASVDIDFEASGFTAAVLGALPIGESFEVHGRLGMMFTDVETSGTVRIAQLAAGGSDSASSQDVFYGIGAALHLGGAWTLSLDYHLFKDVGDEEESGEEDIDLITLGISYRM
jgi:OOP family OmpA-OmpF porin